MRELQARVESEAEASSDTAHELETRMKGEVAAHGDTTAALRRTEHRVGMLEESLDQSSDAARALQGRMNNELAKREETAAQLRRAEHRLETLDAAKRSVEESVESSRATLRQRVKELESHLDAEVADCDDAKEGLNDALESIELLDGERLGLESVIRELRERLQAAVYGTLSKHSPPHPDSTWAGMETHTHNHNMGNDTPGRANSGRHHHLSPERGLTPSPLLRRLGLRRIDMTASVADMVNVSQSRSSSRSSLRSSLRSPSQSPSGNASWTPPGGGRLRLRDVFLSGMLASPASPASSASSASPTSPASRVSLSAGREVSDARSSPSRQQLALRHHSVGKGDKKESTTKTTMMTLRTMMVGSGSGSESGSGSGSGAGAKSVSVCGIRVSRCVTFVLLLLSILALLAAARGTPTKCCLGPSWAPS